MEGWEPGWNEFRSRYPRHEAWRNAEKAYKALWKAGKLPAMVIMKVAIKCQQLPGGCLERRYSNGRDLRPLPASWINGERWHDEFQPAVRDTAAQAMGTPEPDRRDPSVISKADLDELGEEGRTEFLARFKPGQVRIEP